MSENKPIVRFARTFRQKPMPKMNPYFSRATNYTFSSINGKKRESLQDVFQESRIDGTQYGERYTADNHDGRVTEHRQILQPQDMDDSLFSFIPKQPTLSIFDDIFEDPRYASNRLLEKYPTLR